MPLLCNLSCCSEAYVIYVGTRSLDPLRKPRYGRPYFVIFSVKILNEYRKTYFDLIFYRSAPISNKIPINLLRIFVITSKKYDVFRSAKSTIAGDVTPCNSVDFYCFHDQLTSSKQSVTRSKLVLIQSSCLNHSPYHVLYAWLTLPALCLYFSSTKKLKTFRPPKHL
jgi:hypothetical protein